jgi:hypothetical protein
VIDTELGRKDHGSIPTTAIWKGLEPLDARTDPNQIKLVVKNKKNKKLSRAYNIELDGVPIPVNNINLFSIELNLKIIGESLFLI